MGGFASVVMVGNLTRDAQLKYTPSGFPICTFGIAINTRKKQGDQYVDEASFFDVEMLGKTAESLNQYLTKGKMVGVEGELRQDRWEQDGQARSKVKVLANKVQFLGGGHNDKPEGARETATAPAQQTRRTPEGTGAQAVRDRLDQPTFTDDMPF